MKTGKKNKNPVVCMECYWGSPENYNHIALKEIRRLDIHWTGDEVQYYDAIKLIADQRQIDIPDFIKAIIAEKTMKENKLSR